MATKEDITIATEKLEEMLWLIYMALPHDEAERKGWTVDKLQFKTFFDNVFETIVLNFKRNPDKMIPYLYLIKDSLDYTLNYRNSWPETEGRDNKKAIIDYMQQHGYGKNPDRCPLVLKESKGNIRAEINHAYFDSSSKE